MWTVTVRPEFDPGSIATTGETICYAGTPSTIGSVADAQGGNLFIFYSWRSSADNFTADISGANAANYTPADGLTSTTTYRRYAFDGACNLTPLPSAGEWTITIEPTPIAGDVVPNPAEALVCEATEVSASFLPGSGGNGSDILEYRLHDGLGWSDWDAYTSNMAISTTGLSQVEIRTYRDASVCAPSDFDSFVWNVEKPAVSGLIVKTPSAVMVCEGSTVSATTTGGYGGNGNDAMIYRTRTGNTWSVWMNYTATSPIATSGISEIEVATQRLAEVCYDGEFNFASWLVEPTPAAFAGNNASVCAGGSYLLADASISNANGVLWSSLGDGSFNNPTLLNPVYTPGLADLAAGQVQLTLTANTMGVCQVTSSLLLSISTPVSPSVTIAANVYAVCKGTNVQFNATAVNGGENPVFVWKVNGIASGGSSAVFHYAPMPGDVISADMVSSLGCVSSGIVSSNELSINVYEFVVQANALPANGGTTAVSGNLILGGTVMITATPSTGFSFNGWTNAAGVLISSELSFELVLDFCYTEVFANFSSNASLSGNLKFFNPLETSATAVDAQFMVQLFKNNSPFGAPQSVDGNGFFSFSGLDLSSDYALRLWEQTPDNSLAESWLWNNWGGVSGLDGLIANMMAAGFPFNNVFPWIQPGNADYSSFATEIADVNASGAVTANDPLTMAYRIVNHETVPVFPNNRHNFIVTGSRSAGFLYPNAPEIIFQSYGAYNASTPADMVYYQANTGLIVQGNNLLNIFLNPAGDLNASFVPQAQAKSSAMLAYEQLIEAVAGDVVEIPVFADFNGELGAITLGLHFNTDLLDVIDVEGFEVHSINHETGVIKLAWFDQQGLVVDSDVPLMVLKARLKQPISAADRYMELLPITEFASREAALIEGMQLKVASIASDIAGGDAITHQVVPNPFTVEAQISFSLPEAGLVRIQIFNAFGQLVKTIANEVFDAGAHSLQLHRSDMHHSGSYSYTIFYQTAAKSALVHGKFILVN